MWVAVVRLGTLQQAGHPDILTQGSGGRMRSGKGTWERAWMPLRESGRKSEMEEMTRLVSQGNLKSLGATHRGYMRLKICALFWMPGEGGCSTDTELANQICPLSCCWTQS